MMLKFSHDEQCHENEQTSLIMNMHVDYGVEKSLIQLGYKNAAGHSLTVIFLRESPHQLHALLRVTPPHVPHLQPIQGATLSVPGCAGGLRGSAGVLAGNPVQWGEYMD